MLRLTRNQVREIDRRSIEDYHIPGIVLMENAARGFVEAFAAKFPIVDIGVVVVCGPGNNGGDGFAIARHLYNRGCDVIFTQTHGNCRGDALINRNIVQAMKLHEVAVQEAEDFINRHAMDVVIDAMFGTGLTRPLDEFNAVLVALMNQSGLPIVSVDIPSGLDCDTGEPLGACIRATRTITFVAEKKGFANPGSKLYTGEVLVGDIGCPRGLIEEVARLPS